MPSVHLNINNAECRRPGEPLNIECELKDTAKADSVNAKMGMGIGAASSFIAAGKAREHSGEQDAEKLLPTASMLCNIPMMAKVLRLGIGYCFSLYSNKSKAKVTQVRKPSIAMYQVLCGDSNGSSVPAR